MKSSTASILLRNLLQSIRKGGRRKSRVFNLCQRLHETFVMNVNEEISKFKLSKNEKTFHKISNSRCGGSERNFKSLPQNSNCFVVMLQLWYVSLPMQILMEITSLEKLALSLRMVSVDALLGAEGKTAFRTSGVRIMKTNSHKAWSNIDSSDVHTGTSCLSPPLGSNLNKLEHSRHWQSVRSLMEVVEWWFRMLTGPWRPPNICRIEKNFMWCDNTLNRARRKSITCRKQPNASLRTPATRRR